MFGRIISILIGCLPACVNADSLHRFTLPLFNKQGEKVCDIFGQQAFILDDHMFHITDISLTTVANGDNDYVSVISDQADIDPQKNMITGKGFIAISSSSFSATGHGWDLLGEQKQFTLHRNVQVFFEKN